VPSGEAGWGAKGVLALDRIGSAAGEGSRPCAVGIVARADKPSLGDRAAAGLARSVSRGALGAAVPRLHLTGMPAAKPPRATSSADLNTMIARVTPDVLALLADGVPRTEAMIVKALAERHPKPDVKRAIARLAVLGRLDRQGSRYTLASDETGQG
jgi:hypothetical protein